MDQIREGEDFEEGGEDGEGAEDRDYNTNSKGMTNSKFVSPSRKTLASKKIKEMQDKTMLASQLNETMKVENKRVRKDLDVNIVSAKTIEALMRFLGIEPDDSRYGLDNKLNKVRIEI